jgi:hypothetical protein
MAAAFLLLGLLSHPAAGSVGYADGMIVDFVRFAEDVIDGDYLNASVVRTSAGGMADGSLRAAWALNHWAALLALGGVGYSGVEGIDESVRWRASLGGSVDFGQRGDAPVGLSLVLDFDRLSLAALEGEDHFGVDVGVHYTGREDLNLGLVLNVSRVPLTDWDEVAYPVRVGAAINYYF